MMKRKLSIVYCYLSTVFLFRYRASFFLHLSLFPAFLLIFTSCAQMQAPGGGPRDETPPRALHYFPDSAAVNFTSGTVRITFDEYITLKDPGSNLVISPPLDKQPSVKLLKNRIVEVEFKEPLKANTTYTLNFGNAIADIHEGKIADGFTYVFSTGSYIDTLTLFGAVQDAFSQAQEKNVLVMLYAQHEDSLPYKRIPDYFARTGPDGTFQVKHIRPGRYKLVALQDANRNFLFDSEEEKIGFSDTLIDLRQNRRLNIRVFAEEKKKQFIRKIISAEPGRALVLFNKPLTPFTSGFLGEKPRYSEIYWSVHGDTVTVMYHEAANDTLRVEFRHDDWPGRDTAFIRTFRGKKPQLKADVILSGGGSLQDLNRRVTLRFNLPIYSSDIKGILVSGKDGSPVPLDSAYFKYPKKFNKVYLRNGPGEKWKENQEYSITLLPGSFRSFGDLQSDTIRITFKTPELKYYGNMKLTVQAGTVKYIYQLLDEKGSVRESAALSGERTFEYKLLPPGKYRVRLIEDKNANGRWDTGNYLKKLQPEKVIYSPGWYNVRSDWDVEEVWQVR